MISLLRAAAEAIAGVSCCYCVLSVIAAVAYLRKRPLPGRTECPPISLLKPLKGSDPEMYESLRSHCTQQYPHYEIIFGVNTAEDPAAALVGTLQRDFPQQNIRLIICDEVVGSNRKLSSLAQLVRAAKNEFLVVNDSDIRVTPDYLRAIAADLHSREIGLVTCLYRATAERSVWSQIEALGIATDFIPGVLVARLLEGGLHFGLGSTLALRKKDLQRIGGFEAIADYLADDYQLGKKIAELGLKVHLSQVVVETFLPAYDFRGFISHQLRWNRTVRASRPAGYAGIPLTFPFPWAVICLALGRGSPFSIWFFAVACLLRAGAALCAPAFVVRDEAAARSLWLLPFRDLLAPFLWIAGLFGRTIVWRGEVFTLHKGKLVAR